VVQQLFGSTDSTIRQTDIVMLLTPRIVRSHELTATDLAPIYIGPQSNFSLGSGPPPLINVPPAEPPATGVIGGPPPPQPGVQLVVPPGSSPIPGLTATQPAGTTPPAPATPSTVVTIPPGTVVPAPVPTTPPQPPLPTPPPPPTEPAPAAPATPTPPRDPAQPPAPAPTTQTPPAAAGGGGRVALAAPTEMRVGGGPYTVPISINGASRLSTISLSVTYNPSLLRVRSVQEGTFMRQGGIAAAFTNQVDSTGGRIDIAITRPGDQTGAVGTGLLAAILFEPVATGTANLNLAGVGTVAGTGAAAALQFTPAAVVIK
jgi:hypothetical protein